MSKNSSTFSWLKIFMLFRHFFAFPPASDMSAPRLLTAAPSLPAASGLGRLAADTRHHGSSSKEKGKSTHKESRKRIMNRLHPRYTSADVRGKVGVHLTKGTGAAGAINLHLRGGDATSRAEPPSRSGLLPGSLAKQKTLYNTNIMRSMTTVWIGRQIFPGKAWRSHGKPDSRLPTSSSRFKQKNDC